MKVEKEEFSSVKIYNEVDFNGLKKSGELAARTLEYIEKLIKPGVKTDFIDQAANKYLNDHGAFSAPLFYRGYTKSICTSINLKPGITLGDIGFAIQSYAESHGCSVVRDFCGHGIGKTFHEEPNILHYGKKGEGMKLKKGMVFTIEPMINLGEYHTKVLQDGWTAVTKDKSLSAQFEHTVGIVDNGYVIFTL